MTYSLTPLNYIVTVAALQWPDSSGTRHFVAAWTAEDACVQIEVQHEIRGNPKPRFKITKIEPWVREETVPARVESPGMTVIDCYRLGHTLFGAALYLFIGTLVMLLVNELAGKNTEITRQTFVIGMFTWPGVVLGFCLYVVLAYARRISRG